MGVAVMGHTNGMWAAACVLRCAAGGVVMVEWQNADVLCTLHMCAGNRLGSTARCAGRRQRLHQKRLRLHQKRLRKRHRSRIQRHLKSLNDWSELQNASILQAEGHTHNLNST